MNLIKPRNYFLFFMLLLSLAATGQNHTARLEDSLKLVLTKHLPDKDIVKAYSNLGRNYVDLGQMDSARRYIELGIAFAKKCNIPKALPIFYINEGNMYMFQSNYSTALECYLKCISIREQQKDSMGLINAFNSIGIVYFRMNQFEKALDYWQKSLKLCERFGQEMRKQDLYSNIAMVFDAQGRKKDAEAYTLKALDISFKFKDEVKIAMTATNLGELYTSEKRYKEALPYFKMAQDHGADSLNDGYGLASLYVSLGTNYMETGQLKLAHENYAKAVRVSLKVGSLDELREEYLGYSQLFAAEKNMKEAFRYHKLSAQYKDSVFNKQNLEKFNDLKTTYEVAKKEQQLKQKEREQLLLQEVKDHKQKVIDYALLAGCLAVVILSLLMYRSYRIKKQANAVILVQKEEIEKTNNELGTLNKEIGDSINYAKRIQEAILPTRAMISAFLPRTFVFYQPKNVVSGDFYFFTALNHEEVILAACDCTGHGVPGAFMSMIGTEQLNKIIQERKITSPCLILDALHEGVRNTLHQDRNDSRDGMDVAICKLNLTTNKLVYAGANRPLWIIRKGAGQVSEIKADKQPVGGLESDSRKPFSNKEETLSEGDRIYLSSDGYADQFGGAKGKKFMVRNFQELIFSLINQPMKEQEEALRQAFAKWRGNAEQVDDILVIGVEI